MLFSSQTAETERILMEDVSPQDSPVVCPEGVEEADEGEEAGKVFPPSIQRVVRICSELFSQMASHQPPLNNRSFCVLSMVSFGF